MKERASWPCTAWEVNAILEGRKTQKRLAVKPQPRFNDPQHQSVDPPSRHHKEWTWWGGNITQGIYHTARFPYGAVGDRLWLRETWFSPPKPNNECIGFAADREYPPDVVYRKRPSIHMPRWASRITLEVTGVRVERLQEISDADAIAEGIERSQEYPTMWRRGKLDGDQNTLSITAFPKLAYRSIWESIHGPKSWEANDWVWVVEFARITG